MYGASPISEALLNRAMAGMPGTAFHQLYGMTELSPVATHLTWDQHTGEDAKEEPAARLRPRRDRLRGPDRRCRPQAGAVGTVGEVAVRGQNVMMGYWERPEETAKAVIDGWMHTGDGGYMDEEGYVYLVDRVKDMIISGGENVYSMEVENAITQHPAGVAMRRDRHSQRAMGRDRPCLRDPEAGRERQCRPRSSPSARRGSRDYKCPRSVDVRNEPFPLSGAGKVLKRELRRLHAEAAAPATAKAG